MKKPRLFGVWKDVFTLLQEHPIVLMPFIFLGILDGLGLLCVYWAPRYPISQFLAPIIRAYWGEPFLHYPANFLLLPKLYQGTHILVTALFGVLMSGIAIGMVRQATEDELPTVQQNFRQAFGRYAALFMSWLLIFAIVTVFLKVYGIMVTTIVSKIAIVHNFAMLDQILFWAGVVFSIMLESIFIYVLVALITEQKSVFAAFKRSLTFASRNLVTTVLLVLLPSMFFFVIIILKQSIIPLSKVFPPEIVLWILWLSVVVTALIDCVVTLSATLFFLANTKDEVA